MGDGGDADRLELPVEVDNLPAVVQQPPARHAPRRRRITPA